MNVQANQSPLAPTLSYHTQAYSSCAEHSHLHHILPRDLLYEIADFLIEEESLDRFTAFFYELTFYVSHTNQAPSSQVTLEMLLYSYFSSQEQRLKSLAKACGYNFLHLPPVYTKTIQHTRNTLSSFHITQRLKEHSINTLCNRFQNLKVVEFSDFSLPDTLEPLVKLKKLSRINSSFCTAIPQGTLQPLLKSSESREFRFIFCALDQATKDDLDQFAKSTKQIAKSAENILFICQNPLNDKAFINELAAFLLEDKNHISQLLKKCDYNIQTLSKEWQEALLQISDKVYELSITQDKAPECGKQDNTILQPFDIASLFAYFPHLQALTFRNCVLTEVHFEQLFAKREQLTVLSFINCEIATKRPFHVIDLFQNLKKLVISFIETKLTDDLLTLIAKLTKLEVLDLSGLKGLTDKGINQLSNLQALEHLDLSSCIRLTPTCLQTLAKLPLLRHVNLSNCQNFKNKRLDTLLQLTSLRTLKLNRFDFHDPKDLQCVVKMTWLRHVEFGSILSKIDAQMQKAIATMQFLETLTFGATRLEDKELATLQAALPNTRVIYQNKSYKEITEAKTNK